MIDGIWKRYAGDFNSMTDEEIDIEFSISQDIIDEETAWVESVISWRKAGKPRNTEG